MSFAVDLHTHTYLCKHSELVNPLAYLVLNTQSGIRHTCCCHTPFPGDVYDLRNRMRYSELSLFFKYYDMICRKGEELKAQKPLLTLEVDWNALDPLKTQVLIDALKKMHDFDYFIGSLHYNDLVERYFCLKLDCPTFLQRYCSEIKQMIESRLFNVLAHADFLKNYHIPTLEFYRKSAENALVVDNAIADAILSGLEANPDCVVEINTSAKKKRNYLDFFPSKHIIRRLAEKNVKFGISSDCHWVVDVGYQFGVCLQFLIEIGVQRLHYFEGFELKSYSVKEALDNLKVKFRSTKELDLIREEYAL